MIVNQLIYNFMFKRIAFPVSVVLACAIIAAIYPSMSVEDPVYFPDSVFSKHDVWRDQFSRQFAAFKEPSLFQLSSKNNNTYSFRFLWLATGRHPCCVRITKVGSKISLVASQHDGSPGVLANPSERKITALFNQSIADEDWIKCVNVFEELKFWSLPVDTMDSQGRTGGELFVLEGINNETYKVIVRVGLGEKDPFTKLGRFLMVLSGTEMLKKWDEAHK